MNEQGIEFHVWERRFVPSPLALKSDADVAVDPETLDSALDAEESW